MNLHFSIVVPVYNRPQEVLELLESLRAQRYEQPYEIVIVEDGSTETSEEVMKAFTDLNIAYYFKENSGPGASRNYGMQRAKGNYYLILDSDCVLPEDYLLAVQNALTARYTDFFGGPDAAHEDFTTLQKAINYAMTSFLTTGGIRGRKKATTNFEPRSFNMGISKEAFEASKGFGNIHPGEDPDLSIRLWQMGYTSQLIPEAYVFHKRRISWSKFYMQVKKFGAVRPILTRWHPQTARLTFWFPSFFTLGLAVVAVSALFGFFLPSYFLFAYLGIIAIDSSFKNKSAVIGLLSVWAVLVQFVGYGVAFIKSKLMIGWFKKDPRLQYPHLFFE